MNIKCGTCETIKKVLFECPECSKVFCSFCAEEHYCNLMKSEQEQRRYEEQTDNQEE